MLRGVTVDRARFDGVPKLVIGGGLDRAVDLESTEELASWLGAEFEPFAAHSAYGLILGEQSFGQVADSIRGFLELHRL
jgi:alpha-beta hydrolase superfamily lysophospholipase